MFPTPSAQHRQPHPTGDLTQAARLCARSFYSFLDPAEEAYLRNVALSVGAPQNEIAGDIVGACGAIGDVGGSRWYERLRQEEDRFLDERHARIEESRARSRAPHGGRAAGPRTRSRSAVQNRGVSAVAVPPTYAGYMPMQRQASNAAVRPVVSGIGRPAPAQFGRPMSAGAWPSGAVPASLAPAQPGPATFPRYPRRAKGSRQ
jgi:hypothetical protein